MWQTLVAISTIGAFVVAFAAFVWQRQRTVNADAQLLAFNAGRTDRIVGANGEEPLHVFEPSIRARGSGTRYDVHTYLWVDDRVEVKWRQRERLVPRLDNTSDPLTCGAIEIRARDIARVWFGLRYNESRLEWWSQRGLRSHYVRQNLGSGEIEVWRWYRCGEFRKWWQRQTKLRALGAGRQRRLGRWKRVRLHPPAPSQFPNWDGSEPPDE